VVFTDGDPWSYRIYGSVAYGSIKSAHLSEYLATPEADFIGIQPSDIVEYELPTDPLSDSDINALESELEDPRFQTDYWTEQIELQLDIGKKSEQQSLASHGLRLRDGYVSARAVGRYGRPLGASNRDVSRYVSKHYPAAGFRRSLNQIFGDALCLQVQPVPVRTACHRL